MRELCQYENTGLKEHCSPENRKICLQLMWHRRMLYLATNKCNMAFIGGTANSECVQWTYCPISAAQTEETKPDLGICQYKFQLDSVPFSCFPNSVILHVCRVWSMLTPSVLMQLAPQISSWMPNLKALERKTTGQVIWLALKPAGFWLTQHRFIPAEFLYFVSLL